MIEKRRNFCYNVPVHLIFSFIKCRCRRLFIESGFLTRLSVEHTVLQK